MRIVIALSVLSCLTIGCSASRQSTANAEGADGVFHRATEHEVSTREYRVDPPDEIIIKAPNIKELDQQKQKVRPDGKVSFNLLGEVYVAGLTPTEINDLLRKLAEKYYTNPDIKIEVIANSKFYYVFGHGVAKQGRFPYTGRDTIITALAEAGFNESAWPQQVRLSRPSKTPGELPATAVIDFKKVYSYGELTQNYLMEEGDLIEIPFSPLSAWDFKTRRILGPLTGATSAVGSAASINSSGSGN